MSFSNPGYSAALQAAIDYAWANDVVVVAATGNDGSSSVTFPAGDRGVIGVSNTDQSDTLARRPTTARTCSLPPPGSNLHHRPGRRHHHHHGNVGLVGRSSRLRRRCCARRILRLERRHRGPAGPQRRRGRNDRSDRQRPPEPGASADDTSNDAVKPEGAAPVGDGGPLVGPYDVAAPNWTIAVAPTTTVVGASAAYDLTIDNTSSTNGVGDRISCVMVTLPTEFTPSGAPSRISGGGSGTWTVTRTGQVIKATTTAAFDRNDAALVLRQTAAPTTAVGSPFTWTGSAFVNAGTPCTTGFPVPTSGQPTVTVNKANTATGLTSSVNPSVFGQSVTFTATVTAVAPGAGTPTGTVTFKDGITTIGTGMLSGGSTTFSTSALSVASHGITASYGGDTNFNTSTSSTVNQVVNKANTTITIDSHDPDPSVVDEDYTVKWTVSVNTPGAGHPHRQRGRRRR